MALDGPIATLRLVTGLAERPLNGRGRILGAQARWFVIDLDEWYGLSPRPLRVSTDGHRQGAGAKRY
jgi:hypothetical protein